MCTGLSIAAAVAAIGVGAAPVAEAWRDDFGPPELDGRWTWQVPVPGPTVSLTARPGWLRLTVPQTETGFNHWVGEQRAPFLRTPLPAGDWDLTARVAVAEWKPDSNLHLAMVVGFGGARVLAWGPFLSRALYPDMSRPGVWAEPTGQGAYIRTGVEATEVELQISRRVDTYHLRHRQPGQTDWTTAGSYYAGGNEPGFGGLMGKSFGSNPAGALDVDYLALTPCPAPEPEPAIEAQVRVGSPGPERLPPLQRGFFLEFLGHCIFRGIWDERLANRKFTAPADASGVASSWAPFGSAKACTTDPAEPYAEPQSQRLDLGDAEAGISQAPLVWRRNTACSVRVVTKAHGTVSAITVSLRDPAGVQAAHEFAGAGGADWTTSNCELRTTRDTDGGMLVISAKGPGRLWIGAVSLMASDNVQGFRRDVLDVTRLARPPTFRWPGGNMASGYHWRDGIGPRDRRPQRWDRAWNAWVDNDMGTDEFVEYCRRLGAEPCICVNAGEGTAEEAAAWVEYCNGSADTPMGRLRAANGHPEPFGVRYWDVGNEIWGDWQLGHVPPEQYGLRVIEFARLMRRVDPGVVLVASGVFGHDFADWNVRSLRLCGPFVDMLSVHDYTGYDARQCTDETWQKVVSAPVRLERALTETALLAQQVAGKRLPLTFDEWNTVPEHTPYGHGLVDALYAAGVLQALQRHGTTVPMANLALLTNVLGALRTDPTRIVRTPVFLVFRLFADQSGPWPVAVEVNAPAVGDTPLLDAAATLSENRDVLHLTLINRHPRRGVRIAWDLGAARPAGDVTVGTVTGPEPWARNGFENPDTVRLDAETGSWESMSARVLPPASVSAVSLRLGGRLQ